MTAFRHQKRNRQERFQQTTLVGNERINDEVSVWFAGNNKEYRYHNYESAARHLEVTTEEILNALSGSGKLKSKDDNVEVCWSEIVDALKRELLK